MRYPLIFPRREEGWHTLIPLADTYLADYVNLHARRRIHIDSDNDDNEENTLRREHGGFDKGVTISILCFSIAES